MKNIVVVVTLLMCCKSYSEPSVREHFASEYAKYHDAENYDFEYCVGTKKYDVLDDLEKGFIQMIFAQLDADPLLDHNSAGKLVIKEYDQDSSISDSISKKWSLNDEPFAVACRRELPIESGK